MVGAQAKNVNGLYKVDDLENAMIENRRLKKDIKTLRDDNQFLKVNAEKYQKRAVYVRKKFTELTEMKFITWYE